MDKKRINILWLKKDLRSQDHRPLQAVSESELPYLSIHIYEPEVEVNYDFAYRHWNFIHFSIKDLNSDFFTHELYGNALQVFKSIFEIYDVVNIYSHQETGNDVTYKRDIDLKSFFKSKVNWIEFQSNAVKRGLKTRHKWDQSWNDYIQKPIIRNKIKPSFTNNNLMTKFPLQFFDKIDEHNIFKAGQTKAHQELKLFIDEKVENYFKYISFPEKSRYHSSRLSAYLTYGNLSIKQIVNTCMKNRDRIDNKKSLDQYISRLRWHCHFIQKLEMQPEIEFINLNKSFNQIRKKKNKKYIKAWKTGTTGYPLVDAAMRCVQETGYLNFRLRAMVVSFLTHHLWQPWQAGSGHLARCFIDYEPGIHFSQFQMQAGTVGIHTIRVYNPVKQSKEKDKDGVFIKKWIKELRNVPAKIIHEPWKLTEMEQTMYGVIVGQDYPLPIIDHEKAAKDAKEALWALKSMESTRSQGRKILARHSSKNRKRKAH